MTFWTFDTLKRASGGAWLSRGKDPEAFASAVVQGLSTDSRTLQKGRVFLALRGERFDGHDFVAGAVKAGAPLLIVDEAGADAAAKTVAAMPDHDVAILRVPDTGKALLRLAGAYRKTLERTKVVAVVGSNGKTTTTRLIAAVLETAHRGTASVKSFNNAVGVPLTILSASSSDQYLLCEVGTNAPGEIAQLGAVVQPDIIVITSIGREHLEGFGSIEGVAREEASILSYLTTGGLAIVPSELPDGCQPLTDLLRSIPNVVRFGTGDKADLRASNICHRRGRLCFTINGRLDATLGLIGEHNAPNALAALAVGRRFGMEERKVVEILSAAKGPEMRLERIEIAVGTADSRPGVPSGGRMMNTGGTPGPLSSGGRVMNTGGTPVPLSIAATHPARSSACVVTFINDAYNANPDSMLASLDTFEQLFADWPGLNRRIAVIGDMLELGDATESSHREIGARLLRMPMLDLVVLVGPLSGVAADTLSRGGWPASKLIYLSEAGLNEMQEVAARLEPGDAVLLKGSRRMKLERVIESLRARFATSQPAKSASVMTSTHSLSHTMPTMTSVAPAVTLPARPQGRKPGSTLT